MEPKGFPGGNIGSTFGNSTSNAWHCSDFTYKYDLKDFKINLRIFIV